MTFFWVELHPIDIIRLKRRGKFNTMGCCGDNIVWIVTLNIVRMDKIEANLSIHPFIYGVSIMDFYGIPAHMRYFQIGI